MRFRWTLTLRLACLCSTAALGRRLVHVAALRSVWAVHWSPVPERMIIALIDVVDLVCAMLTADVAHVAERGEGLGTEFGVPVRRQAAPARRALPLPVRHGRSAQPGLDVIGEEHAGGLLHARAKLGREGFEGLLGIAVRGLGERSEDL